MAQSLVLSIDVCRGLGISPLRTNIWLELFSGRSWPKIGPEIIFFGFFEKFETIFSKIGAHSERYRYLLAGIFEILTFYGNIAFPLSPVSHVQVKISSNPTAHEERYSNNIYLVIFSRYLGVEEGNARANAYYRFGCGCTLVIYMHVPWRVCYRPGPVLNDVCMYTTT